MCFNVNMCKLYHLFNIVKLSLIRHQFQTPLILRLVPKTNRNIFAVKLPNFYVVNKSVSVTPNLTNFSISTRSLLALSILGWLGFVDDDENKDSELIMTLKRAVLSTQHEQYDNAEQLLHVGLRLAQLQQNTQGILYCYDLMANLAMDRYQLDKAEKLFVSVMQMLLSNGVEEDNLKVIHVSLKLARICHLKAEEEKAEMGYKWCLEKIEKHKNTNVDSQTLYGVTQDWYAQFLLDRGDIELSLKHLKEAYKICCEVKGKNDQQSMLLLNDLGITSWRAGDLESAENFLSEGLAVGKIIEDQSHVGVLYANLGLICLQKGMYDMAQKHCKLAWNLGRKHENTESIEQANYCIEQIKLNLAK